MSEWISVSERLPEEGVPVWGYGNGDTILVEKYNDSEGWLWSYITFSPHRTDGKWYFDAECDDDYSWITHWQPLPPPPEDKE